MSYQVLARKWRPRGFHELVGQTHVVRALVNALDQNRLHHALLFTGTRGVGKTTLSRIFAKSLNCETGIGSRPCGQCGACREIDQGRFVDLIEVDAASRTRVEDTRELMDNVQYTPSRGRFKVYLIDEVHMLSTHSFNALLKTLEEPPPHVQFLLATTDPQKLPVTILSRCLQFNLKRLPPSLIVKHLIHILEQENLSFETAAVDQIARAGEGSMRDALSLLDQAIAFGGGQVSLTDVTAMLGTLDQSQVLGLMESLAAGDAAGVLGRVAELDTLAPDYAGVLADLITLLQRVALCQLTPGVAADGPFDAEAVQGLAGRFSPEDLQLFYQIALLGRRDLPLSPDPRSGFEMVLLRMLAFRPGPASTGADATQSGHAPSTGAPSSQRSPGKSAAVGTDPVGTDPVRTDPVRTDPVRTDPVGTDPSASRPAPSADTWHDIVNHLKIPPLARQLALNCAWAGQEGEVLQLVLPPAFAQLRTANAEERLQAALSDYYGQPVRVRLRIGAVQDTPARRQAEAQAQRRSQAAEAIEQDPKVRAIRETFQARVRPDSIVPLDES